MQRALALVALFTITACAPYDATPLRGTLATAEGSTFFATVSDVVQLGRTNGRFSQVEYEAPSRSAPTQAIVSICATSDERAWAVVDDRLMRRTASGWEEVPVTIPGYGPSSVELQGVGCVGSDHVLVRADVNPRSWSGRQGYLIEIVGNGIRTEVSPGGMQAEFTTSPRGELLATPGLVLRDGSWEGGGPPPGERLVATGGHIVSFSSDGTVEAWAGDEVQDLSIDLEGPRPDLSLEELSSVVVIRGEVWAALIRRAMGCSDILGARVRCSYRDAGYRVIQLGPGGAWETVSESSVGLRPIVVNVEDQPYVVFNRDGETVAESL